MKWYYLLALLSLPAWGMSDEELRQEWLGRVKVSERHASYQDAEILRAPVGTWQTLFSVMLGTGTDCVFARIPKERTAEGILKVVRVPSGAACSGQWEREARWEKTQLRSIQFALPDGEIKFWWSGADGRVFTFTSKIPNLQGVFFFPLGQTEDNFVKVKLVGGIDDEYPANPCSLAEGTCQLCRYGVYRVPGATPEYYCGVDRCGEANQPACQRGTKWLKSRGPFTCRGNHEHVFCADGLKVECAGEVALCR